MTSTVSFVSLVVACTLVACAPATREDSVIIGMDEMGGSSGNGGKGGAGAKPTGGRGGDAMAPSGIGNGDAGTDGPLSNDALVGADAAPPDVVTKLDAAAKLDAPAKLDAASPTKAALPGTAMNCNAAVPAADDLIATFEGAAVETVAASDRALATPAQVFTDATPGTIAVATAAEARCASTKSAVFSGAGFTFWGAVVALDFKGPIAPRQFYDASRYKGIQFYARSAAAMTVRLKISDKNNARWGGVCVVDTNCDDYWGRQLQVGTEWKLYSVAFDDLDTLRAPQFGQYVAKETTGIEFVLPANAAFELHVDDIAFVK